MPKVCHLITRLIVGGAQRLALETAAFLTARGWDVQLWTGPQTGPEGSLHDEARRRGVRVVVVPNLVREISPWRDLRAYADLTKRLRAERFDLVHTHSSKAGIVGRLAAARARVPVRVHSIHGWAMTPATPPVQRTLYALLERFAAQRTHRLVAVSAAVRDAGLAARIGRPDLYRVIHGGIQPPPAASPETRAAARRELGIPAQAVVAGTLGRLDDAKDPLGALQAALPLFGEMPDLRLVFVGDGHLRAALETAVARAGLAPRVQLAGLRDRPHTLLPAFDVFFLSSRWEGFPLAVLEAQAHGLPVVAYDVAGLGEAVVDGEGGRLTAPGDRDSWRQALRLLLADAALRQRMGHAGRKRVEERFTMDRMLRETVDLYDQLLAKERDSRS